MVSADNEGAGGAGGGDGGGGGDGDVVLIPVPLDELPGADAAYAIYSGHIEAALPAQGGLVDDRVVAAFRSAYVAAASANDARAAAVGLARALGKRAAEFAGAPAVVVGAELAALRSLIEHLGPGAFVADATAAFHAIRAESGLDVAGPAPAGMGAVE